MSEPHPENIWEWTWHDFPMESQWKFLPNAGTSPYPTKGEKDSHLQIIQKFLKRKAKEYVKLPRGYESPFFTDVSLVILIYFECPSVCLVWCLTGHLSKWVSATSGSCYQHSVPTPTYSTCMNSLPCLPFLNLCVFNRPSTIIYPNIYSIKQCVLFLLPYMIFFEFFSFLKTCDLSTHNLFQRRSSEGYAHILCTKYESRRTLKICIIQTWICLVVFSPDPSEKYERQIGSFPEST